MTDLSGLWLLFSSSFLASTLLPGGSEATLIYAAHKGFGSIELLWIIATVGNTLGGLTNWLLGWWIQRRYPARQLIKPAHQKAMQRLSQFGSPVLLLSWLPVIGDPLCLAAGWAGIRLIPALLFIALGKALRYALLLMTLNTLLPVT
ncbi:MAG: DedA family protein [Sedimenticola sp.]|uniref:DedA family protein n=1 Tax=Sedimenticola thiotaurini TaxID=1543721 RepID=A0A558DFS1_9GAMM|nr:DedA family protein [Sedimenticola sp.]MCW8946127.1 DedA family protein [Sedimenticola sp.]MCW8948583.1 DedA family protein [Sedimenticola sp.]MCW8977063.1 DedA family protein [Sedimenticola sp.]TVT59876.1 MAG: DedA family protein [Sedimenticola thiotaurini]